MAKPSILVTYKLPSAATAPLEAVGHVEVYRDGVLTHDELVKRVTGGPLTIENVNGLPSPSAPLRMMVAGVFPATPIV